MTADQTEGRQTAYLTLQQIGVETPMLNVPVTWNVVDVITVMPSQVFLGAGGPGQPVNRTIVIRSNMEEPVEIAEANISGPFTGFDVSFPNDPSDQMIIELSGAFPATAGVLSGEFRLILAQPEDRTVTIPVRAIVVADVTNSE